MCDADAQRHIQVEVASTAHIDHNPHFAPPPPSTRATSPLLPTPPLPFLRFSLCHSALSSMRARLHMSSAPLEFDRGLMVHSRAARPCLDGKLTQTSARRQRASWSRRQVNSGTRRRGASSMHGAGCGWTRGAGLTAFAAWRYAHHRVCRGWRWWPGGSLSTGRCLAGYYVWRCTC